VLIAQATVEGLALVSADAEIIAVCVEEPEDYRITGKESPVDALQDDATN
jgi:hypothetical protein